MMNSEIIIFFEFNDEMFRHESFYFKICMLIINELHLINEWKNFRNVYSNINVIKTCLSRNILCVNMLTTLNDETLKQIKKNCDFIKNIKIIKTSLNKSEIYMQYNQLKQSQTEMKNLQHILSAMIENYLNIFKIVIYVDNFFLINELCQHIQEWMQKLNYFRETLKWIKSLSTFMINWNKQRI